MQGIEAINACNGWMMAALGAAIVFSGLVVLSLAISQIHKILKLFENDTASVAAPPKAASTRETVDNIALPDYCPTNIMDAVRLYQPLLAELGDSFALPDLYALSRKKGMPHPHITIKTMREAGMLVNQGEGLFSWNISSAVQA